MRIDEKLLRRRRRTQSVMWTVFRGASLVNAAALGVICLFLFYNGLPAISWEFLTQPPRDSMTAGGIMPCIVGTVLLSLGSMVVAFPLGVCSAIYLNEYAKPGKTVRLIRLGIANLAGVPSVVFGLFGLAFFVTFFGMGVSIISGVLTLTILILPVIIGTAEDAKVRIVELRGQGVDHLMLWFMDAPETDGMAYFMEEVAPGFR